MKKIRIQLLLTIFLSVIFISAKSQNVDTNFHVYLLIGQSNMAGRGVVDEESKKINPRILMLDSMNNWVPATDPVHFDKSIAGVGPALGFANEMLKANDKITIGLIPCAWGGSPIKAWEVGATYLGQHPYEFAITRTKLAMQKGVLKGTLWHQGESDNDTVHGAIYIQKFNDLIQRLRNEFNQPNLPVVAGEIGYFNKSTLINKTINQIPQSINNSAVVSAEGLTHKGDNIHFNTASARELGKRYADAMLMLQSKK